MLGLGGAAKFSANMFGSKLTFSTPYENNFEVALLLFFLLFFCCYEDKGQKRGHKESCMFSFLMVFGQSDSLFGSTNICFIGSHVKLRLMPRSPYQRAFICCCGQASEV